MTPVAPFPLHRNVTALREARFDVLVIGGGIYGAWTAYDAAQRGLRVALVEKDDWAAGTSQASSKLIHGGLRYLEHFEFGLVKHALAERQTLATIAPHLVQPLNFVVPVWRGDRVGRVKLRAGLALYDWLARGEQPVAKHAPLSLRTVRAAHPYLQAEGLRGALRYGDCQEDDARLTVIIVAAAQRAGAVCANGMLAEKLLLDAGHCVGAELLDRRSGERLTLHARCVINCCGPWTHLLTSTALPPAALPSVKLIRGIHLILPAIPGLDRAFLLTAPDDGRVFFVIPWYGRTLVGTTETAVGDADSLQDDERETHYLLAAVAARMPGLGWRREDVIARYAGTRSVYDGDASSLSAASREFTLHAPLPGLLVPIGGKYTTARHDAEAIVDRAYAELGLDAPASTTALTPLPGAPSLGEGETFAQWLRNATHPLTRRGVDAEAARWLARRHGSGIVRIAELLDENPTWRTRLHPEAPFIAAEAVLGWRDEMAGSFDDLFRRRMPLTLIAGDRNGALDSARRLYESLAATADSPR